MKRGSSCRHNLVLSDSTFSKARKIQIVQWTLQVCKRWKWPRVCHEFVDSKPTKTRKSPIKLQGRVVNPGMVATSGEKCPTGIFEEIHQPPTKQGKGSPWFKNFENLQTSLTKTFSLTSTPFQPRLTSFSPSELVLVSLASCHSLNQGCKLFIKRSHARFCHW